MSGGKKFFSQRLKPRTSIFSTSVLPYNRHYSATEISSFYKFFNQLQNKCQIISKRLLVSSDSSKKWTNEFVFLPNCTKKRICPFVFWKNQRIPKSPFKIIWPLAYQLKLQSCFVTGWIRCWRSKFPSHWLSDRLSYESAIVLKLEVLDLGLLPSSIYSCSIGHSLEHEFCHLGCWAVLWKISETTKILLKYATF